MIKIAVCDDEKAVTDDIKKRISQILMQEKYLDVETEILTVQDPGELLSYARDNSIDVLFLDLIMPEYDGIKVAEEFYSSFPHTLIIFTSGYENMVFYTLKFRPFRFVRKSHLDGDLTEATESALDTILSSGKKMLVKNKGETEVLLISKIKYVEKQGNYLLICHEDATYKVRSSLYEFEPRLQYGGIIKINSGMLVNVRFISSVTRNTVTIRNGPVLPVSRKYQKNVESSFMDYVRRQTI